MVYEPKKVKEPRGKFSTLFIEPLCMKKMNYYTQAADGEISGLGTVIKDETGRYVVNEVFLLDQECTATDTDIDPEAISKLMVEMMQAGKDPGQLKFWWHSHVNMGVFWSATDDTACETLSHEFAFSLVVNKRRESLCRLDLYNPFRITFDKVNVSEMPDGSHDPLKEACEAEVKAKVKAPKYGGYTPGNYSRDEYNDYGGGRGYHDYEGFVPGGGYPGYKPPKFDKRYSFFRKDKKDDDIKLSEITVEDIKRLMDVADLHKSDGGMFCPETWDEYIRETLKAVVEMRIKPKAGCHSPLTYATSYKACVDGSCKVMKSCKYFTKVFNNIDADATKELEELMAEIMAEQSKPLDTKPSTEVVC